MAWLSGYSKRKELVLTGGASGALTDHQLKLAVAYAAAMQGDFDDLRFTQSDGETLIDAWAEVIVTDTSATVWVEFPTTPANTVEQDYYMYYGNGIVASDWDGDATFNSFDDFNRSNENPPTGWTVGNGGYEVLSNELHSTDASNSRAILDESSGITPSKVLEFKGKSVDTAASNDAVEVLIGWTETDTGYVVQYYRSHDLVTIFKRPDSWTPVASTAYTGDDNWHDCKVIWTSGNIKVYLDDVLKLNHNTTVATGHVGVRTWGDGGYYDNYRVRKYASSPPTYAFGSEESAPAEGAWYYEMLRRRN